METRWGTFTDPWTLQPQPKCGFVLVGTDGTIASYDYDDHVTRPDPRPPRGDAGPGRAAARRASATASSTCSGASPPAAPVEGPLDPALCLTAQRIVDTAARSAREKRTLELLP